jgi:hypothetical protein
MTPRTLLLALALAPLCAHAQVEPAGLTFVMPHGTGKIAVHITDGFQPTAISLYDQDTRPVIAIVNDKSGIDISYILFPNDTGAPTAESCRDAVVSVIVNNMRTNATIQNESSSRRTLKSGKTVAVTSYFAAKVGSTPIRQQELFGFYGDQATCAEVHISHANSSPNDAKLLDAALERFDYTSGYQPTAQDYGTMAGLFFNQAHSPQSAAPYYQSALDALNAPIAGYDVLTMRRVLTDQLAMSYGMAGDLQRSRAVNEAAIAKDPTYPMYYYNLACADAESGDAASARTHLQQAFDRRANTLPGEKLPDPTQDDSILKLKSDKAFWTFVQSLPKA